VVVWWWKMRWCVAKVVQDVWRAVKAAAGRKRRQAGRQCKRGEFAVQGQGERA
jgi:hypothetical protein